MSSYYEENKDKWKKYAKTQKEKGYHKAYFQEHKEELSEKNKKYFKDFCEKNKGCFLYIILDEEKNVKYVGKTTSMYMRMAQHNGTGLLNDADSVLYFDLTGVVKEEELGEYEAHLIHCFKDSDKLLNIHKGYYNFYKYLKVLSVEPREWNFK